MKQKYTWYEWDDGIQDPEYEDEPDYPDEDEEEDDGEF